MRIVYCLLAVVLAATANAQELPNPKPGKAHKILAKNAGTWDCTVKFYFQGPAGPATESKGVEVNTLVSGDLFVQTSFRCKIKDRQFDGHSLMGYNPATKKYVGTWVDNFTVVPSQMQGQYDKKAKTFTIHSTVVDAASGQVLKQKQVTTWMDASTKKFEIFLVVDTGGGKTTDIKILDMMAKKRR